ncbi:exodeoxyribonuclease III [Candidatus Woesearchaeota archaeon]|nr:MAG: exodeoxyribonuclease III [Candidatus Woesearchaeota archaeon]
MKIVSWNVAGIRACEKKGLVKFMRQQKADVYCLQEVKAKVEDLSEQLKNLKGYILYDHPAMKKGYSGVYTYSKQKPIRVIKEMGVERFDSEGRVLVLEFQKYYLVNAYFPHSHRNLTRLRFKLEFNQEFSRFCRRLGKRKPLVIAADFNVAHKEIDLANPKQNQNNAGFTIQEREWFDDFLKQGYIDTFREFTKAGGNYTWWTYRFNARKRNIGWRVDYFIISKSLRKKLKSSRILKNVLGSDHCPIMMRIDL